MIAQKTKINNAVGISDEATVQVAIELLTQRKGITGYRWVCEVCGMIHTGSLPASCDSCGSTTSLAPLSHFRYEMNSRW